jgi:hypothetical protein
LLAVNLLLRLVVAARPIELLDGLTIPDDAYLSLTLARNLAHGLGPLYGTEPTSGFQPLWVFLMAPVYWLVPHDPVLPIRIALVLLALLDTLTLYFLYRLVSSWCRSAVPPIVLAIAWITDPYVIRTSLNGLETALATCLIAGALLLYHRRLELAPRRIPARDALALGLVLGLAVLARIDAVCLILAFLVARILTRGRSLMVLAREVALVGVGAVLAYGPWLASSYSTTGDLIPISGKAVRFISLAAVEHHPTIANWYGPMVGAGLRTILREERMLAILLAACTVLAVVLRRYLPFDTLRIALRRLAVPLLFAPFLFLAYTLYVFAPWFYDRYLFLVAVMLFLVAAVVLDLVLAAVSRPHRRRAVAGATIALVAIAHLADPRLRQLVASTDTTSNGYRNLGLWARRTFPDGTVIGSSQTGALGYFANNLNVVNLDGVVNKACYESLAENRNMDYIRRAGVQYVVGWPENIEFIEKHSTGFRKDDLRLVRKVEGFRSWGTEWYLFRVTPYPS